MKVPLSSALLALWCAFLTLSSNGIHALFADQAGLNDWTKQNIGEVIFATALSEQRFVVASKQGAVAVLLADTGDIVWRRVMPSDDVDIQTLKVRDEFVVVSTKKSVRVWSADGLLLWDQVAEEVRDAQFVDDHTIAILTNEKLGVFNLSNGQANSKTTRDAPKDAIKSAILSVNGMLRIVSAVMNPENKPVIRAIDNAGSVTEYATSKAQFAVDSKGVLYYFGETNDKQLVAKNFVSGKTSEISLSSTGDLVTRSERVIVTAASEIYLVDAVDGGTIDVFTVLSGTEHARYGKNVWTFPSDGTVTKHWGGKKERLQLGGGSTASRGFEVFEDNLVVVHADGQLANYVKKDSSLVRSWTREEALAEVQQIVSTSLPHKASTSTSLGNFGRILEDFNYFIAASVKMSTAIKDAAVSALRGGAFELKTVSESSEDERARFGFNRVLVMLTKKNKLFGIHSETGKVMWTKALQGYQHAKLVALHETEPDPRVLVLDMLTGKAEVISTSSGTTSLSSPTISKKKKIVQYVAVEAKDGDKMQTVIAMSEDQEIYEFPVPALRTSAIYLSILDKTSKSFKGFRIEPGTFKAVIAWTMAFPSAISFPDLASPRSIHDAISSPVRSLGDGSLLVKHINPNTVGLAVVDETGLKIQLVDTVSGRVIHRATHKEGAEPVHAVRFENWFVYSFWNVKAQRVEIMSLTMYEKNPIGKRQLNPLNGVPKILDTNVTGFEPADVNIFQRMYLLPGHEITALGVTTTLRGIAAKNLLVSLGGTGQILMLDQRLVDPRRTTQAPTEEEKVEGLFQYQPELPVTPTHVLSYYMGAGERGAKLFYVAPSLLESTCTIVAAGLDIFKGRASPSGAFDLLAEDFNYALLALLLVFLGVCVVVLRSMERRKSLEAAWT